MSLTEAFTVNGTDARWIRPGEQSTQLGPHAAYLTRTTIELPAVPPRVVIRATALGVYQLQVNGTLITGAGLYRPGWTDTTRRVQYQEYDVPALLRPGTNVLGAELAPGWHGGRIGTDRAHALVAQLALALHTPCHNLIFPQPHRSISPDIGSVNGHAEILGRRNRFAP